MSSANTNLVTASPVPSPLYRVRRDILPYLRPNRAVSPEPPGPPGRLGAPSSSAAKRLLDLSAFGIDAGDLTFSGKTIFADVDNNGTFDLAIVSQADVIGVGDIFFG